MSQKERNMNRQRRALEEHARAREQQRRLSMRPSADAVRRVFAQHWSWPA